MSANGRQATPGKLSAAGFQQGGIAKGSTAAQAMSHADTSGHGKNIVSNLQSSGAKGQAITSSNLDRGKLDDAGLTRAGVKASSVGANIQSSEDKAGRDTGLKSDLQSFGATK